MKPEDILAADLADLRRWDNPFICCGAVAKEGISRPL